MKPTPKIKNTIAHIKNEDISSPEIIDKKLPSNRNDDEDSCAFSITYGDYFKAIESFLSENDFLVVKKALAKSADTNIESAHFDEINICIEKHGEFYHPARIEVNVAGKYHIFVVNGAVSEAGKMTIERESGIIDRLNENIEGSYIPVVYGRGKVKLESGFEIPMFLGNWFTGYHEFHISDKSDGERGIIVWGSEGNFYLDDDQIYELYKKIALILTTYYNLRSFEQIIPWHHAAGDFIVSVDSGKIDVKLITVRQYRTLIDPEDSDLNTILDGLLVFLLNMSIRMRLDRIDGVHDLAWSNNIAVDALIDGFYEAIKKKGIEHKGMGFDELFMEYCKLYSEDELLEYAVDIVGASNQDAPDIPLIAKNIKDHIFYLKEKLTNYSV